MSSATNKPPELPKESQQVQLAFSQLWERTTKLLKQVLDAASEIKSLKALVTRREIVLSQAVVIESSGPAPATTHDILSTTHTDSTPGAVARGDVITGQGATPSWKKLAISVPAATFVKALGTVSGDTEPGYKDLFDATVPGTIAPSAAAAAGTAVVAARRDHTHGAPATWPRANRTIKSINSYPYTILATDDLIVCH
jgi:hypothetical protein